MKHVQSAFVAAVAVSLMPLSLSAEPASGVSKAALAAAGRQATLRQIDYGSDYCDGAMTVEAWLRALAGKEARSIAWTGGDCVLVNDANPGIDASQWPYCAQARVILAHPKSRKDVPIVEIFLEKPAHGRPGKAYAFRGLMETRDDGPDSVRFRKDFESLWDERFPPDPGMTRCKNE